MLITILAMYAILIVVMTCHIADVMSHDIVEEPNPFKGNDMIELYHGSCSIIKSIDVSRLYGFTYGKGLYMTDKKDIAKSYGPNIHVFTVPRNALRSVDVEGGKYYILPLEIAELIKVRYVETLY